MNPLLAGSLLTPRAIGSGTVSTAGSNVVNGIGGWADVYVTDAQGICNAATGTTSSPVPLGPFSFSQTGNNVGGVDPCPTPGAAIGSPRLEQGFQIFPLATGSGTITIDLGSSMVSEVTVTASGVPEPSTFGILGVGLISVLAAARRRSRRSPPAA
jgi:hypothetical protein